MRYLAIALFAAVTSVPALAANETALELSTGGLVFVRNENLDMLWEDLAISPSEISIRYRIFNKSENEVPVLIVFPMPDIHVETPDDSFAVPTDDPVNLLAFSVSVNGEPVSPAVEQRVIAAGLDRTEFLRNLEIPLAPHLASTNQVLDRLPPEKWDDLRRIGLAEVEEYDSGGGMKKHLAARWTLQTTFFWQQNFAPRVETLIEHRYKPSLGAFPQTQLGSPNEAKEPWYDDYKERYCFNYEFLAALERARKAAESKFGTPYAEQRIEFAHKTWANGLGTPVKEFRLTVDKGSPDNLVSFCGEEAKKISETESQVFKSDYRPDGNFGVLFLKKLPQQ
jgi:hypothetical protein